VSGQEPATIMDENWRVGIPAGATVATT
jgi:hypothetical protein